MGALARTCSGTRSAWISQPVAVAFDLDYDGVVEQAVEERGGDDGIAEDVAPLGEAAVGGEDHGALLVAGVDGLEEQVGAAAGDGQVAGLVDDEQGCAGMEAEPLGQAALALGLGQSLDQLGEGGPVDASCRP